MILFKTNKILRKIINELEDENKDLKTKNEMLTKDNIMLLENASELRAKINGLENILESYAEKELKPKRRGRPKKEAN